jgi:hypothetical protein
MAPRKSLVLSSVQAAGRGIVIKIEGDGESARRALEMVQQHLRDTGNTAERESSHIVESMERVTRALETVGLYMGVREAVEQLKELTAGSAEYGEQMQKAAARTGMSVESLSILHYAADLAHTDFDQLQSGIGKLAINLESAANGNKNLAAAFQRTGVNAKDVAAQSDGVDVAFKRFASTLANTEDAQKRDALAKQLMGKAGVELIPVIMDIGSRFEELSAGAEKAGVKMDELRAERLAKLDDELDKLKESVTGAGLAFTDGLAPGLTKVFEIIAEGSGSDAMFKSWGEGVANTIARLVSLAYDGASALERFFSVAEGGKLTESGRRDWAAADALLAKGRELEELSNGKTPPDAAATPSKRTGPGAGPEVDTTKVASANAIAEAMAKLQEEQDKLAGARRKAADQIQIAEVDAQHKMLLLNDQEYFERKLKLQTDELDAEESALNARQKTLQGLYDHQRSVGALKSGKDGVSAEELKTQRELAKVEEERQTIAVRRAQVTSTNVADVSAANLASEIASLRVAANLEKERNESITARRALLAYETDQAVKKSNAGGGSEADATAIRQSGELQDKKLQIEQVSQRISDVEADYRRRVEDTNDAVTKGDESKRSGARDIQRLNQNEVRALQSLVQEYSELAETLGGPYKQKAADLSEELNKLGRRDRNNDFGKQLSDGMESMVSSIAESAATGKQSFADMAKSILSDIDRMAIKMAEQKFIAPFFENLMNSAGGVQLGHSSGGSIAGLAQLGGAIAPSIWKPPTPKSASTGGAGSVVSQIAEAGAKSAAPTITHTMVDQTSRGVRQQVSQPSWDSQLRQMVTHVMLTDKDEGGEITQAFADPAS